MKAAIIGGGVIGGGWAARFLLNGWDVAVFDPDPEAERKIGSALEAARRSLPALYDRPLPEEGRLRFCAAHADAVAGVDWVQESVPERLDLKRRVLREISEVAPATAIVVSSTSRFTPSDLNEAGGRAIVAHPVDPVYLLPLVELAGTGSEAAANVLRGVGMFPIILHPETDARISGRLLDAILRESLRLVGEEIATTAEIDDAIRMGFGLCLPQTGIFETGRIAGGEAGIARFMEDTAPSPDVPKSTDALVARVAEQSEAQSGHLSHRDLKRRRDDALVGILRTLRHSGRGAGAVIAAHEGTLPHPEGAGLPVTAIRQVPQAWTDYNGHMNEARYLEASSQATDRFMEMIGAGPDYVAKGRSYFSVESHIRHLEEVHEGDRITITTQVLSGDGKKLHVFNRLHRGDGALAATVETLMLHMDLSERRTCPPEPEVAARLARFATAHARLEHPHGAGRSVGARPG